MARMTLAGQWLLCKPTSAQLILMACAIGKKCLLMCMWLVLAAKLFYQFQTQQGLSYEAMDLVAVLLTGILNLIS